MAYVHEIKFFLKDDELYVALFDNPPPLIKEFWIKNVIAEELGVSELPQHLQLDKKYKVEALGIRPFHATKPEFKFMNELAKTAWKIVASPQSITNNFNGPMSGFIGSQFTGNAKADENNFTQTNQPPTESGPQV